METSGSMEVHPRSQSFSSQKSEDSHTAADYIQSQEQMEADAREALPYSIDNCTKELGPLRQILYACLTCSPPSADPAGVCYACSVQCHGEHTLVELFNKRNFTCDCGTTRLPVTSPCALRLNPITNTKGGVHSEALATGNSYNQNFKNRFCGCECDYDPFQQKGTMFQCLGLGSTEDGGCGEDWYHPGCLVGLGPDWFEGANKKQTPKKPKISGLLDSITEVAEAVVEEQEEQKTTQTKNTGSQEAKAQTAETEDSDEDDGEPPLPPGFPQEDDFEGFVCYKCVDANPWIKSYAGAPGFLEPVFKRSAAPSPEIDSITAEDSNVSNSKKRKAEETEETEVAAKRLKDESTAGQTQGSEVKSSTPAAAGGSECKAKSFSGPSGQLSLFFKSDFRDHLCRCSEHFPYLAKHPQLLEEEDSYEPPLSEDGDDAGGSTVGSGSIYERGESALKNVDRVRAIEGVMAYNHLKDKLKPFFQQFAESGKAIGAEDIKEYFEKLRGDADAIQHASESAKTDHREEQAGH